MAVVTDLLIAAKNGNESFEYYPVAKNIPININYNLADVRDPDKRKASFSKTIELYGTNEINKLFENIFSFNVETHYFNKNLKTPCKYIVDSIENFAGDLQLLKVNINPDKSIVYECSIIGDGGSIFVDIGDKFIVGNSDSADDLDFSAYDHNYTRANQIALNAANVGTGLDVLYPFIDRGTNGGSDTVYSVKDFLPCFSLYEYVKKIIEDTGRTFTSTFLSSSFFKHLIVYPNLTEIKLSTSQLSDRQFYVGLTADVNINPTFYALSGASYYQIEGNISYNKETTPFFDVGNQYSGSTAVIAYTGKYNVVNLNEFKFSFTHTNVNVTYLKCVFDIETYIEKSTDGGSTWSYIASELRRWVGSDAVTGERNYNVSTNYFDAVTVATGEVILNAGDIVRAGYYFNAQSTSGLGFDFYDASNVRQAGGTNPSAVAPFGWSFFLDLISGNTNTQFYALATSKTASEGNAIEMQQVLPTKIKQKDLLTSTLKAFNLFIEPEKGNVNNLIIEPFDTFYNTLPIIDFENRTDLSKEQSVNPNILDGKRYIYSYKEDKDYYNVKYKDTYNEVFGTEQIDVENDFIKSDKKTELIFSATPNVANYDLGIVIPKIYNIDDAGIIKTIAPNIRLLYAVLKTTTNPFTYKQDGLSDITTTDYLYAGHTDDPFNPTLDLNFGLPKEVYYSYPNSYFTNNNLYNAYHKQYLTNLIDRDGKFVTKYLWLTPKDIYNFSFRNRIFVDGAYYIVNKIENYNPIEQESTKVELIKLLETVVFSPSSFRLATSTISTGSDVLSAKLNSSLRVGNNIQNKGTNCVAIGDNIFIPGSCSNVTVIGNNIEVPEDTSNFSYINGQVISTVLNDKAVVKEVSADYDTKAWDDTIIVTTGATDKTITLQYGNIEYLESDISFTIQDTDISYLVTKRITIKKVDSGAGNVIIDGDGALIDGSSAITLTNQYESVTLQWDGTNWNII